MILNSDQTTVISITPVTTNMCLWRVFSVCWNPSFCARQSTVSIIFSRALTEKVPLLLNDGRRLKRIISNDDSIFISLRWKITLLKQGEWNSQNTLYSLHKGFQVVYLLDWMNIQDPWTICQGVETQRKEQYHTDKGKKFPLNGRCFRKWISTYHSSCYRIESRTTCSTKNSD